MFEESKKRKNELSLSMFEKTETTGFEDTNRETFRTPFVKILQLLSPELNKNKPEYLEKAKPGLFCNTASKQLYNELNVVVLKIEHNLLIWKPNRGGLVGSFSKLEEEKIVHSIQGLKKFDVEGNDVNDTISFYCVNAKNHSDIFIISLSTASIKYAKVWSTKMRMLKSNEKPVGVSYAGIWNIKTTEDSNDKGSWFTIGNTPTFKRFITEKEYKNVIKPALKLLKNTKVDYSQIDDTKVENKSVQY